MRDPRSLRTNISVARIVWPGISRRALRVLRQLVETHALSVESGDLLYLDNCWYVTHAGLLALARRKRCSGIRVRPIREFCNPTQSQWAFEATVFTSRNCKGFVGCGDADPSNVSPLIRGAEMRVAETRAVNRALRKAYGIGICSAEEIGPLAARNQSEASVPKLPPQPANGDGGPKLRDQLCLLIRQHRLDASLVKQYAAEFCGTQDLRQANREQIQSFITHLAQMVTKNRQSLLCKLHSYATKREDGAA